jgi:predicted dienelactone hydrolase
MQQTFLPKPDGSYNVGFARFKLVNAAAWDRIHPNENRAFEVWVWYPGEEPGLQKRLSYLGGRDLEDFTLLNSVVGEDVVANFLLHESSNSYEGIDIATNKDTFPCVIFSRDLGFLPEYYTALAEHLASKGFFVFSIHHSPLPEEKDFFKYGQGKSNVLSAGLKMLMSSFSSEESFQTNWERNYDDLLGPLFNSVLTDWEDDGKFLLDYLCSVNLLSVNNGGLGHDFFSSRLNLNQVILIGHGFGGMAFQKMLADSHVSAQIYLAGSSFFSLDKRNLPKPTLVVRASKSMFNRESAFSDDKYSEHHLREFQHGSFSDLVFYEHLKNAFEVAGHLFSSDLAFSQIKEIIDPFIDRYALRKITSHRQVL